MQRWCPEPLAAPAAGPAVFERLPFTPAGGAELGARGFRPEAGFFGAEALLRSLSRVERAEVAALIEQDLRREFEGRRRAEDEAREAEAAAQREADAEALAAWRDALATGLEETLRSTLAGLARHTADLAVAMAGKVVRREVAGDPGVLVRNLETVLYKAAAGRGLSVTVHPDDAAWLGSDAALRKRLRIVAVKEDRRLERGGCLVQADDVEWDATVERQLATLGEAVAAALAVPPTAGEDDHA